MKKFLIPIALFAALGGLLVYATYLMQSGEYSPRTIPSPLVGKPLPDFKLASVADPKKEITRESLKGRVYLLNVWASWCGACREEHPFLNQLSQAKAVTIIGLNYKDQRPDALQWLGALGNPYEHSIADPDGRFGIELGVYGVPETFVIDKAGIIRYKHIGPISPESWQQKIVPVLKQLS